MKRNLFRPILYVLFISSFSLLLLELFLRLLGFQPYQPRSSSRLLSDSPIFIEDTLVGYNNHPGTHHVLLNDVLAYTLTIHPDFSRESMVGKSSVGAPHVDIFGCSFFAGMGVNDNQTISYFLQSLLPDYQVNNYSIPGHGLTTQYLLLNRLVKEGKVPKIAVFEMASFHLDRNIGADQYLITFNNIAEKPYQYIYASLNRDSSLSFRLRDTYVSTPRIIYYSSIANQIFNFKLRKEFSLEEKLAVQRLLIVRIKDLCSKYHILPVFILISQDDIAKSTISTLKTTGLSYIISDVKYKDPTFNLYPKDGHPNAKAHREYAKEIFKYLKKKGVFHEK